MSACRTLLREGKQYRAKEVDSELMVRKRASIYKDFLSKLSIISLVTKIIVTHIEYKKHPLEGKIEVDPSTLGEYRLR